MDINIDCTEKIKEVKLISNNYDKSTINFRIKFSNGENLNLNFLTNIELKLIKEELERIGI